MGVGAVRVAFSVFGIVSQVLLVAFFSARRWRPVAATRWGWLAYGFAGLGLPVGAWMLVSGVSWRLFAGPLLMAAWAALGAYLDLRLRVEWRNPIRWNAFGPFVTLYFFAQMFLWWPLWDTQRVAWGVFGALFIVNTALNLLEHFGSPARPVTKAKR